MQIKLLTKKQLITRMIKCIRILARIVQNLTEKYRNLGKEVPNLKCSFEFSVLNWLAFTYRVNVVLIFDLFKLI